jgi:hypothetical protein
MRLVGEEVKIEKVDGRIYNMYAQANSLGNFLKRLERVAYREEQGRARQRNQH